MRAKKYEAGAKAALKRVPELMEAPEPEESSLPVLGGVIEKPVLHHCPDCHAILLVLSRGTLPDDLRLQFVKHLV